MVEFTIDWEEYKDDGVMCASSAPSKRLKYLISLFLDAANERVIWSVT